MTKLIDYIKNNQKFVVLAGVIFLLVILGVLQSRLPSEQTVSPNTSFKTRSGLETQIIWEQVRPGETTYQESKDRFGPLLDQTSSDGLVVYKHKSQNVESFYRETTVATDGSDVIVYVDQKVHPLKKEKFSSYALSYGLGEPDIKMFIKEVAAYEAYVYLQKGIMLYVRTDTKEVRNEIYFPPMPKYQFMRLWGENLTEEYLPHDPNEGI